MRMWKIYEPGCTVVFGVLSALSAELHSEAMDGVALNHVDNGAWNLWQGLYVPVLVDWHHNRRLCWKEEGQESKRGCCNPQCPNIGRISKLNTRL